MAAKIIQRLSQNLKLFHLPPRLATHQSGGPNLEVFKFGMYIMFPIGWMYYFGTNLETKFSVPDFWPEPGSTHKIPFEKEELKELSERLREQRLERRERRLREESIEEEVRLGEDEREHVERGREDRNSQGTFGVGAIERWAHGQR